jgi:hypothetical protein
VNVYASLQIPPAWSCKTRLAALLVYLAATTMATVKAANATNKTLWPQRPTYPIILISNFKRFNLVRETFTPHYYGDCGSNCEIPAFDYECVTF